MHPVCIVKQAAIDAPHLTAWSCPKKNLSFHELDRQIIEIEKQLSDLKIQSGSLVAILHPTSSFLLALLFAVWRLNASCAILNQKLPSEQIDTQLKNLSPHAFISSEKWVIYPKKKPLLITGSLFLFTSGSTARPKIAVLSQENLIFNALGAINTFNLGPNDRWLLSLPLYHVGGMGVLFRSILARATIVFNPQDPLITHMSLVPAQLYKATPIYKKLRVLLLGGMRIDSLPQYLPCFTSYGLTEMGSIVAVGYQTCSGSVLPDREVKILTDQEIGVRGKCLFQGYWDGKELIQPFDQEGWFHTKDLGNFCPSNGLTVLGRKDWQFISGGENIQPEEIEQLLLQIEGILEAVIIPIPDPRWGHIPAACVHTNNRDITLSLLQEKLRNLLPKYKIPKHLFFIDEFPKQGLKIDRARIQQICLT